GGDRKIPYIERFAPGGANNPDGLVRGYPDAWIGPRTPEGALLRGKAEIIYNLEYQFPLVEQQFYGLLLADAGNAWLSYKDIKPFPKHLFKSWGAGVRMVIPSLGTIGFDIAYGFDYTDPGWRPHFIFGSRF
ncbi:MAG: BamA/TamA family outer membrane protein, partial [candidate division Zixibacteria bacterium]|nr:BamA/TamA family outer membrane protein [candidate division Zixibacteria bacterium]